MAVSKSQIAFEELGLGSLLKRYNLNVPPNQRDYSWTEREIGQILEDFSKAANDEGPYFLGTIVTIPRVEGRLEVVDGQQRLATTALLLSAIRDYCREINEDVIVESIENEFLSGIDREMRDKIAKLRLNVDDNEMFNSIITSSPKDPGLKPSRASHERLLLARNMARKHIKDVVAGFSSKSRGDELNRWVSFIEYRALVVLLRVPNDSNAYKMFETLNDRGLRTSQADLIKNFLFGRAGSRLLEVQNHWSGMRGALETTSDDQDITINFLRHALIVQRGHLTAAEVYDAVQDIVKSEATAVRFTKDLEEFSNIYVATFNPDHERWNTYPEATRRSIEVFNLFDIKPMRPLILAIASKLNKQEVAKAYTFLVSLGVRLMIASGTRSGSVEVPLANAAKEIFNKEIRTTKELIRYLKTLTPNDVAFQTAFETARVSTARLARYYLRSLEMKAQQEAEPWFIPQTDAQVINLEHVLPNNPEENWPQFSDEEASQYYNRLGNLTLMRASDNSGLKSMSFDDKKKIYAKSPYLLTKGIAKYKSWTVAMIIERQTKLAKLAIHTWPSKI